MAVNLSITASGVGGVLGIEKRFDLDRNIANLKVSFVFVVCLCVFVLNHSNLVLTMGM